MGLMWLMWGPAYAWDSADNEKNMVNVGDSQVINWHQIRFDLSGIKHPESLKTFGMFGVWKASNFFDLREADFTKTKILSENHQPL